MTEIKVGQIWHNMYESDICYDHYEYVLLTNTLLPKDSFIPDRLACCSMKSPTDWVSARYLRKNFELLSDEEAFEIRLRLFS